MRAKESSLDMSRLSGRRFNIANTLGTEIGILCYFVIIVFFFACFVCALLMNSFTSFMRLRNEFAMTKSLHEC